MLIPLLPNEKSTQNLSKNEIKLKIIHLSIILLLFNDISDSGYFWL